MTARRIRFAIAPAFTLILVLASASTPLAAATIDLTAEASRPASNDLARATLFAEAQGAAPAEAAKRVNGLIADALATAKAASRVKVQSGGTHTYPVHAKGGRIESWRMRSELMLESSDIAALSELVGKLQATLGVAGVTFAPSPATRKKSEDEATQDAIAAFRARAALVAGTFGKPYRIKHLGIGHQNFEPPMKMMRAAVAQEMAPMPMEAGESAVTVSVSGQIEIAD